MRISRRRRRGREFHQRSEGVFCTGSDKDQQPASAKEEEEDDDDEVDDDDEGDRGSKVSELESKFQEELAQESGAAQTGAGSAPLTGSGSKKRSKAEVEEERARMMMPKKDRRLYDKIKFAQGRKTARVSDLEVCCMLVFGIAYAGPAEIDGACVQAICTCADLVLTATPLLARTRRLPRKRQNPSEQGPGGAYYPCAHSRLPAALGAIGRRRVFHDYR